METSSGTEKAGTSASRPLYKIEMGLCVAVPRAALLFHGLVPFVVFAGPCPYQKRPLAVASSSPSPSGLVPTSRIADGALRKKIVLEFPMAILGEPRSE